MGCVLPSSSNDTIQLVHLREPQRSLELRHTVVETWHDEVRSQSIRIQAMVAQCPEAPSQFWVLRYDHTAFTSSNGFARMKTEAAHNPPGARLLTLPGGA